MVFAQILCDWFDLFIYQGGVVEGVLFPKPDACAGKSYFVRESGAYFPSQPAVCIFPAGNLTQQEVVRIGLVSR